MDLLDPFSCQLHHIAFDRLKSHTPLPCLEPNRSVRFYSIYNNSLLSEAKKRIYPFQYLATDSIAKQFAFKESKKISNDQELIQSDPI